MSEIKYEIVKKVGVLSSPLCPSPAGTSANVYRYALGVFCTIN